jgi:hypothetical protein
MEAYYDRMLDAIEQPTWVLRGYAGSLVAVLSVARRRYLHVIYREISQDDGFIITAFIATKKQQSFRQEQSPAPYPV